jgi:hypothetical protein
MIPLLFVGDGVRDHVSIPRLVEGILKACVREDVRDWARLNRAGRGFGRKLVFAVAQARDAGLAGVVAVLDTDLDRGGERLATLKQARVQQRQQEPPFPTALGAAKPHGEAWLLDDPYAVREALALDSSAQIATVRKTRNPKAELERLLTVSGLGTKPREAWPEIARRVTVDRCVHAAETGFAEFVHDVRSELGPLVSGEAKR